MENEQTLGLRGESLHRFQQHIIISQLKSLKELIEYIPEETYCGIETNLRTQWNKHEDWAKEAQLQEAGLD